MREPLVTTHRGTRSRTLDQMTVIRRSICILRGTKKRFLVGDLRTILCGLEGNDGRSMRKIGGVLREAT